MGRAASLLLGCEARAGGRRRGPGRRGLSTARPVTRWFWLRGSRAAALDSERLSQPPCGAGRWGRRGESAPPDRQPGSAGVRRAPSAPLMEAGCSSWEFRNPEAAGVSSPGAAAGTGPAPTPRSACAPPTRELVWDFPANAFRLFAEAALNFLSKVLIRYNVLCSCSVQANGSARLERLVTQGIVIREVQNTFACRVQMGCTCNW